MTAAVVCLFATDLLVFDSKRSVSSIISSPMISSIISGHGKVSEEVKERQRIMTFKSDYPKRRLS